MLDDPEDSLFLLHVPTYIVCSYHKPYLFGGLHIAIFLLLICQLQ
jgi:hypothetical protein